MGDAESVGQLVQRLAARLPETTQALLGEFLTVDEVKLAVEWVADSLAKHRTPLADHERRDLLHAAVVVKSEAHVQHALLDCPAAGAADSG